VKKEGKMRRKKMWRKSETNHLKIEEEEEEEKRRKKMRKKYN
jgi:hypothetical protein